MVAPTLGVFAMNCILDWDEEKTTECAKKRVTGKSTPTVETSAYVTMPRTITLRLRVSSSEKATLYTLEHTTQTLKDENGATIDTVWVESVRCRYEAGYEVPWIAEIVLVCTTK